MTTDTLDQTAAHAAQSKPALTQFSDEARAEAMELLAKIMQESVPQRLTLSSIVTGNNPRTYFDQEEMDELVATVRALGVMQSILVRPAGDGKYEIIAGERRVRASLTVFGAEGTIPAIVANVTKEQAELMALVENTGRANMSPMEEASAAYKQLLRNDNDKEEVARLLGWSLSKLESRLALLRCIPPVRQALTERRIKLGIAELLAALPNDKQASALENVLKHDLSVEYVKQYLQHVSHRLEAAVFDKSDCVSCAFNSASQGALFAEALNDGYCTNGACYEGKTDKHLDTIKDGLSQDYPVVKIVRLGDATTTIPIVAAGQGAVGEDQAKACRGCQNFGCAVSALPESMGSVERDVCFDATCNASKVAQHLRAIKATAKSKSAPAKGDKASGATSAPAPKKATSVQTPNKVKEYRVKLWRDVAKKELLTRKDEALTVLVGLSAIGSARHVSSSKMGEAYKRLLGAESSPNSHDLANALSKLQAAAPAKTRMLEAMSASAMESIEEQQLVAVLTFLQADMTAHWKLNDEYLKLLTKSEIEAVADEVGLKAVLGDKFAKLADGKKDAFIDALLKVENFDYSRAIPAVLIYGHKDATAVTLTSDSADEDDDEQEGGEANASQPELATEEN